ncbi:MAG TPA: adenylate/guanylate cyclase domain-containing protein, partial [Candidatus Dormibacteraeota bacterium]|nr:adenylate/guanylate cyclase domain-containing protein [Candidatus Dormibacteraeota bacterium]
MQVCPSCLRENPDGFTFCGFCSAALLPPESEVRKAVTVLFSDVTGSTELGERIDPETLRRVMSRYFEVARAVLQRHGGTVEKFIGDAVMAVFGVPQAHEDDALRAARAATELHSELVDLNAELQRDFGVSIAVRTGVNSGSVVAGDAAAGQSFVSGDTVNTAARLEQHAEPGEILIGPETLRLVSDAVSVEAAPPMSVKGKTEPLQAFRLLEVNPNAAAHARRLDSRMVGRDGELGTLQQAFDQSTAQQSCSLITVVGAAGVGKSRLIRELSAAVADRASVYKGRCLPYGDGITFWPVGEIVRQAAAVDAADTPAEVLDRIGALLDREDAGEAALIRDRIGAAIGVQQSSGAIQETFWAVRRLLEILSADRPVVSVIDDIHWAEPTLLDLISYVAAFSRGSPLMLVCTARPELREARPDWGTTGTTLVLHPLDAADSEQLLHGLLRQTELSEAVRGRIVETAEGNPLFLEEMLRMLIDDGLLRPENGHWVAAGDLDELSAPGTIQNLLAARLDRLDDSERALIQRASVVGRIFYWGAVTAMSPPEARDTVGTNLQTLLRKELILPEESPFAGEDAFRFSHALVREAAYESIPKRVRAELHERFATWLERAAGARLLEYEEVLGHHLEQAHNLRLELGPADSVTERLATAASSHLTAAGRRAFARGDMPGAASLLRRSLRLIPDSVSAYLEVAAALGASLTDTGEWREADAVLSGGVDAARRLGDEHLEALLWVRLAYLRLHTLGFADNQQFLPGLHRSIQRFEEAGDDSGLAEALTLMASQHFWSGRTSQAAAEADRAIAHARRAGDSHREREALRTRIAALSEGATPAAEVVAYARELMQTTAATDQVLRSSVLALCAQAEAALGNFGSAE